MFGGEFCRPLAALDRCTLNKGAFAFKIGGWGGVGGGGSKMAPKGGSRLIEVAATAGLTVNKQSLRSVASHLPRQRL